MMYILFESRILKQVDYKLLLSVVAGLFEHSIDFAYIVLLWL